VWTIQGTREMECDATQHTQRIDIPERSHHLPLDVGRVKGHVVLANLGRFAYH
jgi:hypothetical protein